MCTINLVKLSPGNIFTIIVQFKLIIDNILYYLWILFNDDWFLLHFFLRGGGEENNHHRDKDFREKYHSEKRRFSIRKKVPVIYTDIISFLWLPS